MGTIPANMLVNVQPSVLSAGGSALDLVCLLLSDSDRVPIGSVLSFPSGAAVVDYFGSGSAEDLFASGGLNGSGISMGAGYFGGYTGATKRPGALLVAQYPTSAVAAWLRGGDASGLSIAQLQALSGTLALTVDGSDQTGSVNLAAAGSFSAAAALIETALNTATAATGSVDPNVGTGTVAVNTGTGSIAGTTMTISAVATGAFAPGQTVGGVGVAAGTTIIAQLTGGTPGATGTYQVSIAQTVSSTALTASGGTLTLSAVASGTFFVGQVISGTGITAGTTITNFLTGVGGTGKYAVDVAQTAGSTTVTGTGGTLTISAVSAGSFGVGDVFAGTGVTLGNEITAILTGTGGIGTYLCTVGDTAASTAISVTGASVAVTFDSISGGFLITSGTTGPASSITVASGTIAAPLFLTTATGAVTSQGSAATSPAAFMASIVAITQNWATFTSTFDPDNGSGNSAKLAFAAWNNGQNNRYAYVPWDTDITPTESVPASGSLGYLLQSNDYSGTSPVYCPSDYNYAAFMCGWAASLDFTRTNGRTTLAFRNQAGLVPTVSSQAVATNLGGDPQAIGSFGNGYNYYGAFATAADVFNELQRGTISGAFEWFDSYVNQIWLNNALQQALMTLLQNSNSIPYNAAGYALIEAACQDPITAALNFGAIRTGVTLSAQQKAQVNAQAGRDISSALFSDGYYLQVQNATAQVRQSRASPPITLWYMDGESVQAISLASILIQ